MKNTLKNLGAGQAQKLIIALAAVFTFAVSADNARDVRNQEILNIAQAIRAVHPFLSAAKRLEYAGYIHSASHAYQVEPAILVAIAMQESGFRDNLPEGAAGELGICQIIKHWLGLPSFRAEFGKMSTKQLRKPGVSFLVAAWILKDLKDNAEPGTLPYWSFYNSRKFENRFKYFLKVNRNLAVLREKSPLAVDNGVMMVASEEKKFLASRRKKLQRNLNIVRTITSPKAERVALLEKETSNTILARD